jgi:hypothetical protein
MGPPHEFSQSTESDTLEHTIRDGLRKLDRLLERLERRRGAPINAEIDTADLIVEFAAQRERLLRRLEELQAGAETLSAEERDNAKHQTFRSTLARHRHF